MAVDKAKNADDKKRCEQEQEQEDHWELQAEFRDNYELTITKVSDTVLIIYILIAFICHSRHFVILSFKLLIHSDTDGR